MSTTSAWRKSIAAGSGGAMVALAFAALAGDARLLESAEKESRSVSTLLRQDFEASGVAVKDGTYYIVFDNRKAVAKVHASLKKKHPDNQLVGAPEQDEGFEGITYDAREDRFFVVTETVKVGNELRSALTVLEGDLRITERKPLAFTFDSENKGFEGIAHVRGQGELYLLLLCEGNDCKGGKAGRKRGKGRIQVFREQGDDWTHIDEIKLPESLKFKDYSGLDVRGNVIAVTSQEDSRLWIGRLQSSGSGAGIDFAIDGEGELFRFDKGETMHCNVEGVAFIDADRVVVVSDRRKDDDEDQGPLCAAKHQSIHVFTVP